MISVDKGHCWRRRALLLDTVSLVVNHNDVEDVFTRIRHNMIRLVMIVTTTTVIVVQIGQVELGHSCSIGRIRGITVRHYYNDRIPHAQDFVSPREMFMCLQHRGQ